MRLRDTEADSDKVTILQLRAKLERAERLLDQSEADVKRVMDERDDALSRAGTAEAELRRLQQANQDALLSRLASAEPTAPDARVARLERLVLALTEDTLGSVNHELARHVDDVLALRDAVREQ